MKQNKNVKLTEKYFFQLTKQLLKTYFNEMRYHVY